MLTCSAWARAHVQGCSRFSAECLGGGWVLMVLGGIENHLNPESI